MIEHFTCTTENQTRNFLLIVSAQV